MTKNATRRIYADDAIRGLYIDARHSGKSFRYRYTDSGGKARSITLGREPGLNLSEARIKVLELSKLMMQGEDIAEEKKRRSNIPNFSDYIENTYLPFSASTKRSYDDEKRLINTHLIPFFGDKKLSSIKKIDIKIFIEKKIQDGYKSSTVNRLIAAIKMVFNRAEEWEIIQVSENPSRSIRGVRNVERIDRFLTPEEAKRLRDEVCRSESPMLRYIVSFLLLTGARKREALDAQWMYIDFDKNIWTIPISKSGRPRYVPLSPAVINLLRHLQDDCPQMGYDWKVCKWIFPNPRTLKPFINIFFAWNRARNRAGLGDVRIHDLRHSFASALVNEGMTLYDVKEILGHSNMATTTRYAHLSKKRLVDIAAVVSDHFKMT